MFNNLNSLKLRYQKLIKSKINLKKEEIHNKKTIPINKNNNKNNKN